MKYDTFLAFREYLQGKHSPNTAKKYYFAVQGLFDQLEFDAPGEIPEEEIRRRMAGIRGRNDFSAAKRGLIALKECFPEFPLPEESFFQETARRKRNCKKRDFPPLELDGVKRSVNAIPDDRLKLAYRLMLASGARVSEVADLEPEDIQVNGDQVQIHIRKGKGGKERTVEALPDAYLARRLPQLTAGAAPASPVFYSAAHMQNQAAAHGFECHDLRRAFAQEYRNRQKTMTGDVYTANGNVMEAMGHEDFRTTKRYLRRRIVKGRKTT